MKEIIYSKTTLETIQKMKELELEYDLCMPGDPDAYALKRLGDTTDKEEAKNKKSDWVVPVLGLIVILINMIVPSPINFILSIIWAIGMGLYIAKENERVKVMVAKEDSVLGDPNADKMSQKFANGHFLVALKDMIEMEQELKTVDLSQIKYISKGVDHHENDFLDEKMSFGIMTFRYKDFKNKPLMNDDAYEYLVVPTENGSEEYFNFKLVNVVSCENQALDFTAMDFFLSQIIIQMGTWLENNKGEETAKVFLHKAHKITGEKE